MFIPVNVMKSIVFAHIARGKAMAHACPPQSYRKACTIAVFLGGIRTDSTDIVPLAWYFDWHVNGLVFSDIIFVLDVSITVHVTLKIRAFHKRSPVKYHWVDWFTSVHHNSRLITNINQSLTTWSPFIIQLNSIHWFTRFTNNRKLNIWDYNNV